MGRLLADGLAARNVHTPSKKEKGLRIESFTEIMNIQNWCLYILT